MEPPNNGSIKLYLGVEEFVDTDDCDAGGSEMTTFGTTFGTSIPWDCGGGGGGGAVSTTEAVACDERSG